MIETILQGILGMLSAINGEEFFLECYTPLGEVNFIHAFQLHRNDITLFTVHFYFISSLVNLGLRSYQQVIVELMNYKYPHKLKVSFNNTHDS